MRTILNPILVASALLAPGLALAAPVIGQAANEDCSDLQYADTANGELYALKLTTSAPPAVRDTDWLFDLREKGGLQSNGGTVLAPDNYSIGEAWNVSQADTDVHFVYITYPAAAPGQPAKVFIDSGVRAAFDFQVAAVQQIGNSLPATVDAGIGLTIPGTNTQYGATLRPATAPKMFPVGASPSGSATYGSVNIAFSPLAEVNSNDRVAGVCDIGGVNLNPLDPTRGAIIGYNVYRIPATGTAPPPHSEFDRVARTLSDADGGWVYFLDLRTFNVTLADGTATGNAPSDTAVTDLAGLQNPDGRMYSGDEVLILQDNENRAGVTRTRANELAPMPGVNYWYAVQPVVRGNVSSFPNTLGFTVNDVMQGQHQLDLNGDGSFDAIDLDLNGTADFISFQAEARNGSQDGLGLTAGSMPALSAPMFFNGALALPAFGQVSLSGSLRGNDVNVQFTTGLEKGNVLGYNVYRVTGDQRVRVNEQPILAQGSESNVYSIVDSATRSRGVRSVDYMVEIVYSDGTASTMVGPFAVSLDQQPVRRRR
jgi:surface antigen